MRRLVVNSIVVAFVLPLGIAAWSANGLGAYRSADAARALTAGVPISAYILTGVAWFFLLHSGVFYPVFDAGDLQGSMGRAHPGRSMGGPFCPCSWAPFGPCVPLRPLETARDDRRAPFVVTGTLRPATSPDACGGLTLR